MTIRKHVADRVALMAGLTSLAAFVQTHEVPHIEDSVMRDTYVIGPGTFGERKAKADRIADSLGAVAGWRNGYYRATSRIGALSVEIVFAPPITEADALEGAA